MVGWGSLYWRGFVEFLLKNLRFACHVAEVFFCQVGSWGGLNIRSGFLANMQQWLCTCPMRGDLYLRNGCEGWLRPYAFAWMIAKDGWQLHTNALPNRGIFPYRFAWISKLVPSCRRQCWMEWEVSHLDLFPGSGWVQNLPAAFWVEQRGE